MHYGVIISTAFFIGGLIAGIYLMSSNAQYVSYGGGAIGVGYLIYLIGSFTTSTIRGYITNLKKFDNYKQTYDKMVKGRGYFRFYI